MTCRIVCTYICQQRMVSIVFCRRRVDIFAVTQHPGADQADDLTNLRDAIRRAGGGTLLCLDTNASALRRIW